MNTIFPYIGIPISKTIFQPCYLIVRIDKAASFYWNSPNIWKTILHFNFKYNAEIWYYIYFDYGRVADQWHNDIHDKYHGYLIYTKPI